MHNTREGRANLLQEMPGNSQEPTGPSKPQEMPGNSQEPTGPSKPRPHYPAAQQPGWVGGKTQGKLCRQDCSVTKPTVHRLSCSTQLEHAHIQCTLYGGVGVERGPVFCQTQPNREHQHLYTKPTLRNPVCTTQGRGAPTFCRKCRATVKSQEPTGPSKPQRTAGWLCPGAPYTPNNLRDCTALRSTLETTCRIEALQRT